MIEFTESKKINPCRLTKEDLSDLISLIRTDFSKSKRKEDFEIVAHIPGADIPENSLEDLLAHKNLPDFIDRLSIRQIGWSKKSNIDKSVYLTFYSNFIELRVSGESESWVKGKKLQIEDFLRTKKPFFWFLQTTPTLIFRGSIISIIILGLNFIFIQLFKTGLKSVGTVLPLGIIFLSILDFSIGKFPYVRIYLKEKKTFIDRYNTLIVIAALIGSIFTVIGVVFQIINRFIK